MLKIDDIIKYIEAKNKIELLNYQKEILEHIIRGDIIYTPRGCGRSLIYNGYADYLKEKVSLSTDYSVGINGYDKVFRMPDILAKRSPNITERCNLREFIKEYECDYYK